MVFMETPQAQPVGEKGPGLTPKAVIHQKYGSKACYRVEEVQQFVDSGCPGLAMPQQARSLYRCSLDLPDLSVVSDAFTRKKDAEQSAAKIAIERLGIQPTTNARTPQEAYKELVARLSGLFTEEFLVSAHPLTGHFRVALRKTGANFGRIPMSAIAASDVKVNNLCKVINPKAETDPLLLISLIVKASKMCASVITSDQELWISKRGSYSDDALQSLMGCKPCEIGSGHIESLRIPSSLDEDPESLTLDLTNDQYYLDLIAQELGNSDSSRVLISRTVGKASSEMKIYYSVPNISDLSVDLSSSAEENSNLGLILNKRASYLTGQNIYGDAIFANVGFTWKSLDLFYEDVSLCTYYRMLLNKLPNGHYKLSREAILAAELPSRFTSRSNWRGPFPRDLLCVFCRQHRLAEPLFSVKCINSPENPSDSLQTCKKCKSSMANDGAEAVKRNADAIDGEHDRAIAYKCELKLLSRTGDPIIECSFDDTYRKEIDAIQNAALKVLTWFNQYFKQLGMQVERLHSFGQAHNINVYPVHFSQEFAKCLSLYAADQNICLRKCSPLGSICNDVPEKRMEREIMLSIPEGPGSGIFHPSGSLTCISYAVALVNIEESSKETLEIKDEFEFEIGTGSVINQLEACINQLSVNQSAEFAVELPSRDLIMASSSKSSNLFSQLSSNNCFLEFSVKLLRVTEPLEDRMEQALFSPPLSKQRLDFAVQHINDYHATTLVDFGCGSGSLLDSLLEQSTTLEKIVGVDISIKGLTRAAKVLHSKLSDTCSTIRSAVLYDGSITDFDSRVDSFDVGTCLEVIEHMEEDQARLFGDVVLSMFCPRVLVVSTPNYEYNTVLQKIALSNKEDDPEEKSAPCKFRNYDHKFEWTREQFEHWANNLATNHNYSVVFSGVGGSGDVEPGFASQIAVFSRSAPRRADKSSSEEEFCHPYKVVWEWPDTSTNSTPAL